jgi:hypothetical protein
MQSMMAVSENIFNMLETLNTHTSMELIMLPIWFE